MNKSGQNTVNYDLFSRIFSVHVGIYIPVAWSLLGNGIKSVNLLRIKYQLPPLNEDI